MDASAHAVLSQWETFFFLIGSSGAALTGLMFVVITLAADTSLPRTPDTVNAFATPNIIHFVAVFFLSAVLTAPWQRLRDPAHLIGAGAIAGIIYVLIVLRRMRRQARTAYKPVLEDWIWHEILPMAAYAMLFVAAAGLSHDQSWAFFLIGGMLLLLLSIGIHNAWDTVTYMVVNRKNGAQNEEPK
jgi:hypothetical protein